MHQAEAEADACSHHRIHPMLRHCGTVAQELSLTQNYYRVRGGVTESALVAGPRPGLAGSHGLGWRLSVSEPSRLSTGFGTRAGP